MFCSTYRQPIQRKMTNHFWYRIERFGELTQDERAVRAVSLYTHMHEASRTPETKSLK